jgi:hypothetical protein
MREVREILRLKYELGLTNRQVGSSLNLYHVSAGKYLADATAAGVVWPLPADCDDWRLEELLRGSNTTITTGRKTVPDVVHLHHELRRKGVTLQLLWEEYAQRTALFPNLEDDCGTKHHRSMNQGIAARPGPDTGSACCALRLTRLGCQREHDHEDREAIPVRDGPRAAGAHGGSAREIQAGVPRQDVAVVGDA